MANTGRRQTPQAEPAPRRRKGRGGRVLGGVGMVVLTLVLIGLTTGIFMLYNGASYLKNVIVPEANSFSLDNFDVSQSSTLLYYDGEKDSWEVMDNLFLEADSSWVSLDDIPENLVNATIAIEDKRFRTHSGVDWRRTLGAVKSMFTGSRIYGGSTITQQLIKNLTEEDEVTVKRKVVEIFRALAFEKKHSKEEILEWYLNVIYLGENCEGVGTAARAYFGKEVSQLDLAECASLIGITNNPSLYDPYLHADENKRRQETILEEMCKQGMISEAERDAAIAEELQFVGKSNGSQEGKTDRNIRSWYEDEVISQVMRDLQSTYGYSAKAAKQVLYSGGLTVYTCLDPKVQAAVDEVYSNTENLPYTSKKGQAMQSGITVVDNSTGAVVALSGGMGEKKANLLWSRATDTLRQPGSSIKPIAVYAPALEQGIITPYSVADDSPYMLLNGDPWPANSHRSYAGRVSIDHAVTESLNTIAVRVLAQTGVEFSFDFLSQKLGITSLESGRTENGQTVSDYGLAQLALGGLTDGVSTYEMAGAYAAFPRGGSFVQPYVYTRVVDGEGNELLSNTGEGTEAMSQKTAYYINTMLERVITSGTGTAARFSGMTIAGKTGTTTSNYDRWFVGYSPYYTAAVWTGYDSSEKMSTNGNPAAVLWKGVMSRIHTDLPNEDFAFHSSVALSSGSYCADSGLIPTEYCSQDARGSRARTGSYVSGDGPTEYCTLHVGVQVCRDDPILDENGDPTGQYHLAGEHCPEDSVMTIGVMDYTREDAAASVSVGDSRYLKSWLEAQGTCTVHTAGWEPELPTPEPGDSGETPSDGGDTGYEPGGTTPGGGDDEPYAPDPDIFSGLFN